MLRVAINGFGRIGRGFLRYFFENRASLKNIAIVAINDLMSKEAIAHLFKYDSVFGVFPLEVQVDSDHLLIDKEKIALLSIKSISDLPWKDLSVDIVIEATGIYSDANFVRGHIEKGAKKVLVTAPISNEDCTIVMGVNHSSYQANQHHIVSNASCTTNCLAPVLDLILKNFGVRWAFFDTVHAYTMDQRLLDSGHKDLCRARAASLSMIPTKTGATKALDKVLPALKGKVQGSAIRVPVPNVSLVNLTLETEQSTSVQKLQQIFKQAEESLKGILKCNSLPLVSIDFCKNTASVIVDIESIQLCTVDTNRSVFKLLLWYDNEWAYVARVLDLMLYITACYKKQ